MKDYLSHTAREGHNGSILILSIGAGLLWTASMINTGLVASFPSLAFQLGETIQLMFFFSFVVFFSLFSVVSRKKPSIFENGLVFVVFSIAFLVGTFLVIVTPSSSIGSIAVLITGVVAKSCSTTYFLFFIIKRFLNTKFQERSFGVGLGSVVMCVCFSVASILSEPALRVFNFGLAAAIVATLGAFSKVNKRKDEQVPMTSAMPMGVYGLYGICMGAIPGLDALASGEILLNRAVAVALFVAAFCLLRWIAPKLGPALWLIISAFVGTGVVFMLPLGVPAATAVHAAFVFSWLFFWTYLSFGIPFDPEKDRIDPLLMIIAGFAIGWICFRLLRYSILSSCPGTDVALSFVAAIIAVSVPIYSIMQKKVNVAREPLLSMRLESSDLNVVCQDISKQYHLTKREAEVFALLAAGYGRQYVSEKLVISEGTARTHIKHIYRKLNVHSKEELLDLVHKKE